MTAGRSTDEHPPHPTQMREAFEPDEWRYKLRLTPEVYSLLHGSHTYSVRSPYIDMGGKWPAGVGKYGTDIVYFFEESPQSRLGDCRRQCSCGILVKFVVLLPKLVRKEIFDKTPEFLPHEMFCAEHLTLQVINKVNVRY